MIINGKERGFLLSIGAFIRISEISPGGNIQRLGELANSDNAGKAMGIIAEMATVMSEAYEEAKSFNGKERETPLTKAEVLTLPLKDFQQLQESVMQAFQDGQKQTVEVEPEKKTSEKAEKQTR